MNSYPFKGEFSRLNNIFLYNSIQINITKFIRN